MRILILTAIPFWHPGTSELINQLKERNVHICAIDIFHGLFFNDDKQIVNITPFKTKSFLARLYLKLCRKKLVKKFAKHYDILDIHFIEPAYAKILKGLPNKIICSFFGSDLFRTDDRQKHDQFPLIQRADKIVLSENMIPFFKNHFKEIEDKFYINQYGSKRLDLIISNKQTFNLKNIKSQFNFPTDKKIITCGYNNKKEQQHFKIISSFLQLPDEYKSKIHLVFPMTYGDVESSYIDDVKNYAKQTKIDCSFILERLNDQQLSELRIVSDITVNAQTTDALSSTLKEAMAAGDILILADWLPYQIYTDIGIYYISFNFSTLTLSIKNVLDHFEIEKERSIKNAQIIADFASWEVLTDKWIDLYKTTLCGSK